MSTRDVPGSIFKASKNCLIIFYKKNAYRTNESTVYIKKIYDDFNKAINEYKLNLMISNVSVKRRVATLGC